VERDWYAPLLQLVIAQHADSGRITAIAQGDSAQLTMLNTYMRRIDLLSKLGAPVRRCYRMGHLLMHRECSFSYPYSRPPQATLPQRPVSSAWPYSASQPNTSGFRLSSSDSQSYNTKTERLMMDDSTDAITAKAGGEVGMHGLSRRRRIGLSSHVYRSFTVCCYESPRSG